MKVDGNEFLRNIEIEKDKAKLAQEQKKLDERKKGSIRKEPDYFDDFKNDGQNLDPVHLDISSQTDAPQDDHEDTLNKLQDIMLEPDKSNKNKKKYLIVGLALILLFILALVVIRVVANSDKESQLENIKPQQSEPIKKEQVLDKIDSNEEFEKVIKKQERPTLEEKLVIDQPKPVVKKEIELPEPIKEKPPVVIEKPQEPKKKIKDLFGLSEQQTKAAQKVEEVKKQVSKAQPAKVAQTVTQAKKKVVVPPPAETNFAKKEKGAVKGYYIQIGAYTKKPSDKFLQSITKKGFRYAVHTMQIKGKTYNKVLIGSYPSRNTALKDLKKVKTTFKNPNAYVLKF